jgi:hypothetical protein
VRVRGGGGGGGEDAAATAASHELADPHEVGEMLQRLADARAAAAPQRDY